MTPKQLELLRFFRAFVGVDARGCPPSYDEMRQAMGHAAKGTAFFLMRRLEEQGYVRRKVARPQRPRNWVLTAKGLAASRPVADTDLTRVGTAALVDELRRRGCGASVFADVPAAAVS